MMFPHNVTELPIFTENEWYWCEICDCLIFSSETSAWLTLFFVFLNGNLSFSISNSFSYSFRECQHCSGKVHKDCKSKFSSKSCSVWANHQLIEASAQKMDSRKPTTHLNSFEFGEIRSAERGTFFLSLFLTFLFF